MNEEFFSADRNKLMLKYHIKSSCGLWLIFFIFFIAFNLYAQSDDLEAAQRYVRWIQQAIDSENWHEAQIAITRASDFESVSSDIPFLHADFLIKQLNSPVNVIFYLDKALAVNRWVSHNRNQALFLKAGQLIIIRDHNNAVDCLNQIDNASLTFEKSADIAHLRLLAFRGMASGFTPGYDHVNALAQFRSLVLSTMDRFPRDSRPLRIFLEYARNKSPQMSNLPEGDLNLLELVLRRTPFLLDTDPELAWMASHFIRDLSEARRLVSAYRSGGISNARNRDFIPHHGSIPAALNLGLLGDNEASDELFSGGRSFNNPLPPFLKSGGNPVLDRDIITDVYNLLRSEEGRSYFTEKLLSFSGFIFTDEDKDGYFDSFARYDSGVIQSFEYDPEQKYASDFFIIMEDGVPDFAMIRLAGRNYNAFINWERYPFVEQAVLGNPVFEPSEIIKFGPAVFRFAPVTFNVLGGSGRYEGLLFPVPDHRYIELTYRTLIAFCTSITRSSPEIDGADEIFYLTGGVIRQAVEILNEKTVSITDFERGFPVRQRIDLDLDGRMETTRLFRRAPLNYTWDDLLNYRNLIESSESDWHGDGRFKTKEVYQLDGSVVYYFDMNGSGHWTQSETGNR